MENKRYVIVRIDEGCPIGNSVFKEIELQNVCNASKSCSKCLIGDTKEQLIAKITQVMFRKEIKYWRKDYLDIPYKKCLEQAKEIVEFLGVE